MNALFTPHGWADYQYWERTDRDVLRRINNLISELRPDSGAGIGKPERLRGPLDGCWSRRITGEHRLVYLVNGDKSVIMQARYHYR